MSEVNGGLYLRCEAECSPTILTIPDDARFATAGDRSANREALRPLMVGALAARSAAEWFTLITGAGVPCGPINDVGQGVALAESLGLDPVVWPGDPATAVPSIRNPVDYSATPPTYRRSPPALGADSAEVRAWLEGP